MEYIISVSGANGGKLTRRESGLDNFLEGQQKNVIKNTSDPQTTTSGRTEQEQRLVR